MAAPLCNVHPLFDLKNRNFIVTGGGQGIGFAVVRAIAEYGGNIAVLDIRDQPIDEYDSLATEFGVKTTYIKTDVSNEESLTSSFTKALDFLGSVHGAFTSAGIAIDKPFVEQTWAEAQRIQDINVSCRLRSRSLAILIMDHSIGLGDLLYDPACGKAINKARNGWKYRSRGIYYIPYRASQASHVSL